MKNILITLSFGFALVSGSLAATATYVNETDWLNSAEWSTWTHSQTTEGFESYPDRRIDDYWSTFLSEDYNSSVPANTMALTKTAGFDGFPNFRASTNDMGITPLGGSAKMLVLGKLASTDSFRMSFTNGVRAVSLFIGDLGDAGLSQNTGLLVKDQTGATLWQSSNRGVNHTYGALTLTSGNGGWGFLGFTTDASEGFTYLDLV